MTMLVFGRTFFRPDICRRSRCPSIACITTPELRNSKALKNACVTRWKHRGGGCKHTNRDEHVTQLADGAVGEDFFQIELPKGNGGGE